MIEQITPQVQHQYDIDMQLAQQMIDEALHDIKEGFETCNTKQWFNAYRKWERWNKVKEHGHC